jgi:hypothetical protein
MQIDDKRTIGESLASREVAVIVHHQAGGVELDIRVHAAPHGQQLQGGKHALQPASQPASQPMNHP